MGLEKGEKRRAESRRERLYIYCITNTIGIIELYQNLLNSATY